MEVAEKVHESNVWLRGCKHNVPLMFEGSDWDDYDSDDSEIVCGCGCCRGWNGPSQRFLDACVPYAWASMHQTIMRSPVLVALLGPDG